MNKKVILLIISLCLLALAGGCKKEAADPNGAPTKKSYDASKYVTLGQYKGVKVSYDKYSVTDADLDSVIQDDLKSHATSTDVTDRPVQNGDTVNIDFQGLKDGVAFDGGTAQGYDLEIGSGSFIPGFEEGLIGAKIGDTVKVNVTFPADYSQADLAGQPVVFNVKINSIKVSTLPELTDQYVKDNTDYDTVAAYKDAKRASLETYSEQYNQSNKENAVIQEVIKNAKVSSVPENLLSYYTYMYGKYQEQMISNNYQMTVADYIKSKGETQEQYDADVKTAAESLAKREMIEKAIAKAEGIKITNADYTQLLPKYMSDNGVDTEANLRKYETKKQTMEQMLLKKVEDFLIAQAVVTENPVTTDTTPTTAPEATPTVAPTTAPTAAPTATP